MRGKQRLAAQAPIAPDAAAEEAKLAEQVAQMSGPVETWLVYVPPRGDQRYVTVGETMLYLSKTLASDLLSAQPPGMPVRVSVEVLKERSLLRLRLDPGGMAVWRVGRGGVRIGGPRILRWLAQQGVGPGRYRAEVRARERAVYVDLSARM